jgi:hypothetical protein
VSQPTDPKVAGWRVTSLEWWREQRTHHQLFISAEVLRELSSPKFPDSERALEMVHGLNALALSLEVTEFAKLLVSERLMPGPATEGDALHVAAATIHKMDYLLTWNVRHLANPNKRTHFGIVCMRLGLAPPILITPDLLQEDEDE